MHQNQLSYMGGSNLLDVLMVSQSAIVMKVESDGSILEANEYTRNLFRNLKGFDLVGKSLRTLMNCEADGYRNGCGGARSCEKCMAGSEIRMCIRGGLERQSYLKVVHVTGAAQSEQLFRFSFNVKAALGEEVNVTVDRFKPALPEAELNRQLHSVFIFQS